MKKVLSIMLSLVMVFGIFAALPVNASEVTVERALIYNGHTYELFFQTLTWKEAKEVCEERGGYLAVINSAEENTLLKDLASAYNSYIWLGGSDEDSEGNWHWVNGDPFTYTCWGVGEPNNLNEEQHYLRFHTYSGRWDDAENDNPDSRGFICEYDYTKTIEPAAVPAKTTEYNNHKYELYTWRTTWNFARYECESMGGHLATVSSAEENEVLYDLTDGLNNGVWIGGTDEGSEGNWRWITGEDFSYTNWAENNQPDNNGGAENYLEFRYEGRVNGVWNDRRNNDSVILGFICEYEPDAATLLGDVDGDGEVTIIDATVLQRQLVNIAVKHFDEAASDVDGDGEAAILDVTYLQRWLAGIACPYAIGDPIA